MAERSLIERLRDDGSALERTVRRISLLAEGAIALEGVEAKDQALAGIMQAARELLSRNVEVDTSKFEGGSQL